MGKKNIIFPELTLGRNISNRIAVSSNITYVGLVRTTRKSITSEIDKSPSPFWSAARNSFSGTFLLFKIFRKYSCVISLSWQTKYVAVSSISTTSLFPSVEIWLKRFPLLNLKHFWIFGCFFPSRYYYSK